MGDVVHTKENSNLLFLIFIYSCIIKLLFGTIFYFFVQ